MLPVSSGSSSTDADISSLPKSSRVHTHLNAPNFSKPRSRRPGRLTSFPIDIKELGRDANFECNEEGIVCHARDNSYVALVPVKFGAPGFKRYRCASPMPLGVNLTSLTKVLRRFKDDNICNLVDSGVAEGGQHLSLSSSRSYA
ncbi:proliferating cell nuclear antigen, N-terminal domain-containing protein [Flammula alnicola]|nr:proliferating cell nuclear antigen, N-terminal domain-containing protein [Flammula alnicola]